MAQPIARVSVALAAVTLAAMARVTVALGAMAQVTVARVTVARVTVALATVLLATIGLDPQTVHAQEATVTDPGAGDAEILEPDVAPELIRFVEAEYPPEALRNGREGTVLLELLVNAAGVVDSVRVFEAPSPEMGDAAAAAAARFLFSPARVGEEAVPVLVQYRYAFSIREEAARLEPRVNFRGVVKERGTGAPIAGASVSVVYPDTASPSLPFPRTVWLERIGGFNGQSLVDGRVIADTDSTGRFGLRTLPPGRMSVRIVAPGYRVLEVEETLGEAELLEVEYRAERESYSAYELLVVGRAEPREVTRQRLSVVEVERLPGFGGDVIKSVQALPGVARPSISDPGAVVVRGSGRFDTRYVLDGVDIPLLFHYGGVKSTYNSLALGSVDLYPGGFGPRYGGCVGGVIEVRGRSGRTDRWRTVLDASLLDASFHTEGPLGRGFSLLATGRRSYAGELIRAALESQDEIDLTMAPYYADLVARVDYEADADNRVFLTTFLAKDRMELIFPEEDEGSPEINEATDAVDMDLAFSRVILGWDRRIGRNLRNELRAAWGRSNENGHAFGFFDWEVKGPIWQLRDELSWRVRPDVTVHGGLDLAAAPLDYRVAVLGWPASKKHVAFSDLGAYGAVDWRPSPGLLLTPGIRFDRYGHLDQEKLGLRLSARYTVHPAHTLTAAAGMYNQPPQPIGQSTDPVYGNPDLPPTEATHYAIGDEWRIDDRTSLKVETYLNRQTKIPALTDSLDLNFLPDAEGRMYGVEIMLRREIGERFFGWLAYSLTKSERRYARRPAGGTGEPHADGLGSASQAWDSSRWWPYEYDQTHHLEAVGSWAIGKSWSTGVRMQYTSGNPTTPMLGLDDGRFEFDSDSGDYEPVLGEYFSERMDPYFRFDFRVEKKFVRSSSIWSVYLDVQNLNYFLYNSPEGYAYNYDYSRRDDYGWIILPALGCRVEF